MACDVDIDQAVEFSNLAAGVVVGKIGSATASINEIIEFESSLKTLPLMDASKLFLKLHTKQST